MKDVHSPITFGNLNVSFLLFDMKGRYEQFCWKKSF